MRWGGLDDLPGGCVWDWLLESVRKSTTGCAGCSLPSPPSPCSFPFLHTHTHHFTPTHPPTHLRAVPYEQQWNPCYMGSAMFAPVVYSTHLLLVFFFLLLGTFGWWWWWCVRARFGADKCDPRGFCAWKGVQVGGVCCLRPNIGSQRVRLALFDRQHSLPCVCMLR